MGLNWNWNEKMGYCVYDNGDISDLYQGNALVIAIHEFKENEHDYYNLSWFAADEAHLKNMLGLNKGYDACMQNFGITDIHLNAKYSSTAKIVTLILRSKWAVNLHIYHEEVQP